MRGSGAAKEMITISEYPLIPPPLTYTHSKCYHSLVQLNMGNEGSSDMAAKEQAWAVFTEVLEVLETKKSKVCPSCNLRW